MSGAPLAIAVDDPRRADVRALLEAHLRFADEHSRLEDRHDEIKSMLLPEG